MLGIIETPGTAQPDHELPTAQSTADDLEDRQTEAKVDDTKYSQKY